MGINEYGMSIKCNVKISCNGGTLSLPKEEEQIRRCLVMAGGGGRGCHSWETLGESYGSHSSRKLSGAHGYPILELYPRIKLQHRETTLGQDKS